MDGAADALSALDFRGGVSRIPRQFGRRYRTRNRGIDLQIPARLALEDGTVFEGFSIGAAGVSAGEVVFNTAITGYQEILTDPSYAQQHVTLTYPHIGNVGVNDEDVESGRIWAAGLIVRDVPRRASNWRQRSSLPDYLRAAGVTAIAGLDTRQLTRHVRERGAMGAAIATADAHDSVEATTSAALVAAREFPGLEGQNLAQVVSTQQAYEWDSGLWSWPDGHVRGSADGHRVVVVDFGVKHAILRNLAARGCRVTVVPATSTPEDVLALQPDGVLLSNGPGDPEPVESGIAIAARLIESGLPTFGICLGHQILAIAAGARSEKMPHGHHGANHPVKDHRTGRVFITSQNHGFAVATDSLPEHLEVTHTSLFDGTLQGFVFRDRPVFGFQGHPEASPGPREMGELFDRFVAAMSGGVPAAPTHGGR